MNKSWRPNVLHYTLEFANRVDFKCSHHTHTKITMGGDRCVKLLDCGNHFTIYILCIYNEYIYDIYNEHIYTICIYLLCVCMYISHIP